MPGPEEVWTRRCLATLAILTISACGGGGGPADTAASAESTAQADSTPNPSCLPTSPAIRGSLVGQRAAAQKEVENVRVKGDGAALTEDGATVLIAPACGSHTFREGDLARGQFVARLTIQGRASRFSRYPDDTVYWWVYLDLTSGKPVFKSQFLSTKAVSDSARDYLRYGDFVIRCKVRGAQPKEEIAAWEDPHDSEACPADSTTATPSQKAAMYDPPGDGTPAAMRAMLLVKNNPWYGCFLGCCQSSVVAVDEG